ncbi:hypothetical protein HOLleu_16975 [Holothuria leucospilota]|uniref:Uncharacterized protein n=1 Tax=Holothuria leucospilota TaxID=206669 RepID=A0A9Q1C6Y7_HOLLE|nr:hypothetical protein HOLleu_16975 [Holothuria leucospilota]
MSSRRRGNRGGAFPGRGRGAKYVSTTNSESSVTLNFSVQVSSATHATEVQHGNVNVNRGRGSRGRRGFQPHVGSDRGKAHAKSKGSFQPPKHSSVPCKDGGSVMVQQRRETNQDSSKQASKTVNTSACEYLLLIIRSSGSNYIMLSLYSIDAIYSILWKSSTLKMNI